MVVHCVCDWRGTRLAWEIYYPEWYTSSSRYEVHCDRLCLSRRSFSVFYLHLSNPDASPVDISRSQYWCSVKLITNTVFAPKIFLMANESFHFVRNVYREKMETNLTLGLVDTFVILRLCFITSMLLAWHYFYISWAWLRD